MSASHATRISELRRRLRGTSGRGRRLRGLAALLAPYRGRVVLMIASLVIGTAASLAPAPLAAKAIDDGILPALYAATTPHAEGGAFYGPSGFYEMNGGGVKVAHVPARARNDADSKRLWELSEQLTGVSYPNPH